MGDAAAFILRGIENEMAFVAEERGIRPDLPGNGMDCGIAGVDNIVILRGVAGAEKRGTGADLARDGLLSRGTLMGVMVSHTYSFRVGFAL